MQHEMIYWFRTESGFASRAQFMLNKHEIPIHVFAIICNLTFFLRKISNAVQSLFVFFLTVPHACGMNNRSNWKLVYLWNNFLICTGAAYDSAVINIVPYLFFFCKQNDDKVRNQLQSDAKIAHNHWIQLPRPIITHSESGYIKKTEQTARPDMRSLG